MPLEIFPNSFRCFLLGTVPSDTRELLLVHWEPRWGELQHLANTGGLSVLSTNSDLASKEWGQNQQNFYFDCLSCFRYLWLHSKLSRLSVKKKKNNGSLLQLFLMVPRVDWQFLLEVFSCNPRVAGARVGGHLLESSLVDLTAGLKGWMTPP